MSLKGKSHRFPSHRRLILDICRVAKHIPSFPVDRSMQLLALAVARDDCPIKISWVTLFLRSYSLVCAEVPELRQLFYRFPWPRLYEHPSTVASVSVHRKDDAGTERLIWARIDRCESSSLRDIQHQLDAAVNSPIREVFRDGLRLESFPAPLRRMEWWLGMNFFPRQRAKKIGTFSLSTLAGEDASNYGHPIIVTSSLSYTRCDALGRCTVTLLSDHRVVDGILVARALRRLEEILTTQVIEELKSL